MRDPDNSRTARVPRLGLLIGILLASYGLAALALSGDQSQPIEIEADGVEIDDGRQLSVYKGNVEIQQGSMRLWADQVTVHHKPSRQPARIVAVGRPARFRQKTESGAQEVRAKAMRMEYDVNSEEIVLIDDAVLTQGKDSFSSDRILYDRNKAVVKAGASAKGRERVRISIDPSSR
jgi:lipopolysaccharide export system protein LptA